LNILHLTIGLVGAGQSSLAGSCEFHSKVPAHPVSHTRAPKIPTGIIEGLVLLLLFTGFPQFTKLRQEFHARLPALYAPFAVWSTSLTGWPGAKTKR